MKLKYYKYALTTLRSRYDPSKHDKYLMPVLIWKKTI